MHRYFVSVGSNLDPRANVVRVIEALLDRFGEVQLSRVIETEPAGFASAHRFLNLCASIRSDVDEAELKANFNALETNLGRDQSDPGKKLKDRPADVDILFKIPGNERGIRKELLPREPYVRPTLLELLDYLGIASGETSGALPEGVALASGDVPLGRRPVTLYRDPGTGQIRRKQAALVTGGAVRLGRAIALALAGRGFDVALHYHASAGAADETAEAIRRLGVGCRPLSLDLSQVDGIPGLVADARAVYPHLSLLVNGAAGYIQAGLLDTSPEMFDSQIAVNLRAPFFLTQAFARQCRQGNVINVIDNKVAFNQYPYAAYLLAKKGLAELTRMAALELAPAIRVNGVAPGVVLPGASRGDDYLEWRKEGIPLKMQGEPEHILQAVLYILDNPFVTGQILVVDGGESINIVGRHAADYQPSA
jgi:2-amino-4-hydroxy-6-hydroxymethyldihydropteridine diphosphokinase